MRFDVVKFSERGLICMFVIRVPVFHDFLINSAGRTNRVVKCVIPKLKIVVATFHCASTAFAQSI